jgi:hypothetical protein
MNADTERNKQLMKEVLSAMAQGNGRALLDAMAVILGAETCERRPGQDLAVRAVARENLAWFHLCGKANCAAVARSFDLHFDNPR